MELALIENLDLIPAAQWNALAGEGNPFLRHEFLVALERHGCVGERLGWIPQHLVLRDGGRLVGAVPMYRKYNSYGELVFDWSWAEAYERLGLPYYPKLVVAVPYTPVTGARLLLGEQPHRDALAKTLIQGALEQARSSGVSSLHWLFTDEATTKQLEEHHLHRRVGAQFHWENRGYGDFDDFLDGFSSEKRKKIKRERRRVVESGVVIEVLEGGELSDNQWETLHGLYCSTFWRKSGYPTLTLEFFRELGRTMPRQVVVVLARYQGRYVAGTFNMRGGDTFYGRHWGALEEFHSLHFEACYYRPIEYCIHHGLRRFEAGAQGEHKLSRGFLPVPTYSAHWIGHQGFDRAVADFLVRERRGMDNYIQVLDEHSPYKQSPGPPSGRQARGRP